MRFILDTDVMVPMADGTGLATDIYRPEGGDPVSTVLVRTPYDKDSENLGFDAAYGLTNPKIHNLLAAGYAVAMQECRGTYGSEGVFEPGVNEAVDGAEAVRWITDQPWSNGKVGTTGLSYLAFDQWQTAKTGVPGLTAIVPSYGPADLYNVWYSNGGAFSLSIAHAWTAGNALFQLITKLGRGEGDSADLPAFGALMVISTRSWATRRPTTSH